MAAFFSRKKDAGARADRVSLASDGQEDRAANAALRSNILLWVAMVAVFIVLLEIMFPAAVPGSGVELSIGQIAREEMVAPVIESISPPSFFNLSSPAANALSAN